MNSTIHDVARMAGVSTATVSRVINGVGNVRPETRQKVLEAIEALNYQPNALARGLLSGSTNTVGIIMPNFNSLFYTEIVQGISRVFNQKAIIFFLCNTEDSIETEKRMIRVLLERRVDGFIFIGTRKTDLHYNNHIRELAQNHPVLMINDQIYSNHVYSILTDEIQGAYDAVSYLIGQGHRKIIHITCSNQYTTYKNKRTGYEMALRDHDLPIRHNLILYDSPSSAAGKRAMDQFFASGWDHGVTAVFCANDQLAMGAQKSLLTKGYSIPGDFSVMGFGGTSIAEDLFPSLSTVCEMPFRIGETAASSILSLMAQEGIIPLKQLIQPKLSVRDSIGPARSHCI